MAKKVYLACPYSHKDPEVSRHRFVLANAMAGKLMKQGYVVFSPLSHSVPIEPHTGHQGHDFWMEQDLPWLALCDEMHILKLYEWWLSKGIDREIEEAVSLGIPIVFHRLEEAL